MQYEIENHLVFEEILPKSLASSFDPRSSAWPRSPQNLLILQSPLPTLNERIKGTQTHTLRLALAVMCSAQPPRWRLSSGTGSVNKVASLRLVACYSSEGVSEAVVASGQIAGIEISAFSRTAIIATRHHNLEL